MKKIYVIVNTYTDFDGSAIATDGGAFFNLDVAKVNLYSYVFDIWEDVIDEDTIDNCFETDMIWFYEDDDGNMNKIEICETEIRG
jgi:hypothetical protein